MEENPDPAGSGGSRPGPRSEIERALQRALTHRRSSRERALSLLHKCLFLDKLYLNICALKYLLGNAKAE